jgi:hypothetical protein
MSDMNSALSGWQLAIIIVIPLALLCGWIITVFMVAREPRAQVEPAASSASPDSTVLPALPVLFGSLAGTAVAGDGPAWAAPADEATGATEGGQDQPTEPPGRRLAA